MAKRSTTRLPAAPPPTLLPGETLQAYQRHRESWYDEFPPGSDLETDFVERLCERSWLLKRCERLHNDALTKTLLAHPDPGNWSPETHKFLQLLDRYRLSADRAYRAAWRDIETLRKNRVDCVVHVEKLKRLVFLNRRSGIGPRPDAVNPNSPNPTQENRYVQKEQTPSLERSNNDAGEFPHAIGILNDVLAELPAPELSAKPSEPPKTEAQLLFQGQLNPTRKRKIVRLEQWVEVTIQNGVTVTKQVPSNYHMIRKGQKMWPPPQFVYRRINFPQGVPDEYAWTCTLNPEVRENGGCGLQRMTVDDWLVMIKQEEKRTDGHIGRTIRGNLPRPAEHGECDCPVCTLNRPLHAMYTKAK